jgi:hypothetical protein
MARFVLIFALLALEVCLQLASSHHCDDELGVCRLEY